jgi:hypothetical protein
MCWEQYLIGSGQVAIQQLHARSNFFPAEQPISIDINHTEDSTEHIAMREDRLHTVADGLSRVLHVLLNIPASKEHGNHPGQKSMAITLVIT